MNKFAEGDIVWVPNFVSPNPSSLPTQQVVKCLHDGGVLFTGPSGGTEYAVPEDLCYSEEEALEADIAVAGRAVERENGYLETVLEKLLDTAKDLQERKKSLTKTKKYLTSLEKALARHRKKNL